MLRKLALHLAAQPDGPAGPAGPAGPGPARGAVEAQQDESPERVNHFCDLAGDGVMKCGEYMAKWLMNGYVAVNKWLVMINWLISGWLMAYKV